MQQAMAQKSLPELISRQFFDYFFWYVGAFLALAGTHYCQGQLPFLAKRLGESVSDSSLAVPLSTFAFLALGIFVFRTSSRLLFFTPARFMEKNLRSELLSALEMASPFRYQKHNSGDIFTILFSDIQQMRALIGFALLQVGNVVMALLILVPKLYSYNENLVVAFLPMVLSMVILSVVAYIHQPYFRQVQDLQSEVQNILVESYNGKQTIKNYQSEPSFIKHFNKYCLKEMKMFFTASKGPTTAIPLVPLSVGISFVWGCIIIKDLELGASSLILFSGFIFLFLEPLLFLSWIGVILTRSTGSWQRIVSFSNSVINPSSIEKSLLENNKSISKFDFNLPFWKEVGLIRFKLIPEKWNIIIAKTGHGKSTILKYIAEVLNKRDVPCAYLGQEPYLYNDTIFNNIFLGIDPSQEEINLAKKYCEIFDLNQLASRNQNLMDLEVGENGKNLSGGQAKRLAIIRSIVRRPQVLIWDDPFSSVDLLLEKEILNYLKEDSSLKNITFVLTSHRLSTAKSCDYLLYLEQSSGILEEGAVKELINPGTSTYEFFKSQII